jgi:hypothetical protein
MRLLLLLMMVWIWMIMTRLTGGGMRCSLAGSGGLVGVHLL